MVIFRVNLVLNEVTCDFIFHLLCFCNMLCFSTLQNTISTKLVLNSGLLVFVRSFLRKWIVTNCLYKNFWSPRSQILFLTDAWNWWKLGAKWFAGKKFKIKIFIFLWFKFSLNIVDFSWLNDSYYVVDC